jgi:hypothetical protein
MCTQKQLTGMSLYSLLRTVCVALAVVAPVSVSTALLAAETGQISVRDAHVWHEENGWFLDAQCDIRLSPGAREALENGIPLVFELRVQIVRTHNWLWDVVKHERTQQRQLQYHALSRGYLVKDIESGRQGVYNRLDDALYAVGLIDSLLLTSETLDRDRNYIVRLRGSHDIESLPTPVRLPAYVSSEWDMNSQWFTWPLAQ